MTMGLSRQEKVTEVNGMLDLGWVWAQGELHELYSRIQREYRGVRVDKLSYEERLGYIEIIQRLGQSYVEDHILRGMKELMSQGWVKEDIRTLLENDRHEDFVRGSKLLSPYVNFMFLGRNFKHCRELVTDKVIARGLVAPEVDNIYWTYLLVVDKDGQISKKIVEDVSLEDLPRILRRCDDVSPEWGYGWSVFKLFEKLGFSDGDLEVMCRSWDSGDVSQFDVYSDLVLQNLISAISIDRKRKGAAYKIFHDFGIVNFSNYEENDLLEQLDEEKESKTDYVLLLASSWDSNGGLKKGIRENKVFWHRIRTELKKEGVLFRIYEALSLEELEARIEDLGYRYGSKCTSFYFHMHGDKKHVGFAEANEFGVSYPRLLSKERFKSKVLAKLRTICKDKAYGVIDCCQAASGFFGDVHTQVGINLVKPCSDLVDIEDLQVQRSNEKLFLLPSHRSHHGVNPVSYVVNSRVVGNTVEIPLI